jgi:predicted MFS family arabinose efflux permease
VAFRHILWALIGGVILLDASILAGQVSNQTRIYSLLPDAPSRANTIYMTSYFGGGAVGAAVGAYGWNSLQWDGVSVVGVSMLVFALIVHLSSREGIIPSTECIPAK